MLLVTPLVFIVCLTSVVSSAPAEEPQPEFSSDDIRRIFRHFSAGSKIKEGAGKGKGFHLFPLLFRSLFAGRGGGIQRQDYDFSYEPLTVGELLKASGDLVDLSGDLFSSFAANEYDPYTNDRAIFGGLRGFRNGQNHEPFLCTIFNLIRQFRFGRLQEIPLYALFCGAGHGSESHGTETKATAAATSAVTSGEKNTQQTSAVTTAVARENDSSEGELIFT